MRSLQYRFLAGALASAALVSGASAAEQVIRIATHLPGQSHIGENMRLFESEVEAASEGSIDIQIYDSAQLYKDSEIPDAVSTGQIEMGTMPLTQLVGLVPAVDVFGVPFVIDTIPEETAATTKGNPVRDQIDAAVLEKNNTRILWWQYYGPTVLLSKEEPLHGPTDLEGKKVRTFGKTLGTWVQSIGGIPTLISGSEQFIAFQRGTVDIGLTGLPSIESRCMWDVAKTITMANLGNVEQVVLVNADVWNGLDQPTRDIIEAAAAKAENAVRASGQKVQDDALAAARRNGMTVYEPTEAEREAWRGSTDAVVAEFLERSGDLGKSVYDAAIANRQAQN